MMSEAMDEVFPWARHLGADERLAFAEELLGAQSDDAVHRAIVSWRATARIYADPVQREDAAQPLDDGLRAG